MDSDGLCRRGLWALKVARRASRVLSLKTRGQRWVGKANLDTEEELLRQIGVFRGLFCHFFMFSPFELFCLKYRHVCSNDASSRRAYNRIG